MPPELMAGADATPGHDVYAAGVLLYECVAGRLPFDGPDLRAVVMAVLAGGAPPVIQWRPECPASLAAVIARSMARRTEDRFADAMEMHDALAAVAVELGLATGPAALGATLRRDATPTGRVSGVRRRSLPARATGPTSTPQVAAEPATVRPVALDENVVAPRRASLWSSIFVVGIATASIVLSIAAILHAGLPHILGALP
jgi:serine/threonine-protein kinase